MFIVIEGIDGAGCETQAKMVAEKLREGHPEFISGSELNQMPKRVRHDKVSSIKFPHYDTPVGKMIKDFLYQNKKLSAKEQFILYTLQFISDAPKINQMLTYSRRPSRIGNILKPIVIADRYFTTALCYQALEGFDEDNALSYAKMFGIIKPDLVFFLDVKPETAIKWKFGEGKELNFREKDLDFMKKSYEKYQDLISRQVWTKWVKIDGKRDKETIADEIVKYLI